MTLRNLIGKNILYYRRPYLAVLAGVIVSTAVLTGALLVGDSVRGSLGRLTEIRLGNTHWAMQAGERVFRSELAAEMASETGHPVVPLLQLTGIGINPDAGIRMPEIVVTGVESSFSELWNGEVAIPQPGEVVISNSLANRLNLQAGDPLLIRLPIVARAPRNAPFVAEESPPASLRLTVKAIALDEEMGRFSLKSNQQTPFNAFVSLTQLTGLIGLPGSANMLLVPDAGNKRLTAGLLDTALRNNWKLPDAGILITPLENTGSNQVTTDRIFFDDQTADAVRRSNPDAREILTYLANGLTSKGRETPYSFVAAVVQGVLPVEIPDGKMVITDWLAEDLGAGPGDSIRMTYFEMGPLRRLREKEAGFLISAVIPISSIPDGESMMPDFPGMSDAGHCSDWETGTPVDLDKIRDKDEAYWNSHKGTPKAFISMNEGKRLWNNPFGSVTSFRMPDDGKQMPDTGYRMTDHSSQFAVRMLTSLAPSWYGMKFQPVREQGQLAASNSTDFGGLFLSLSFFLIASSLLLTAMLFSLNTRTRVAEAGVMSALGFRKSLISRILFSEAMLIAVPGVILGSLVGILYNKLIIIGLNTIWQDAVRTSMLSMEIRFSSLLTGAVSALVLTAGTLYLVLRRQLRQGISIRVKNLLSTTTQGEKKRQWIPTWVGVILACGSMILLVALLTGILPVKADLFLMAGGLMMTGGLFLLNSLLGRQAGRSSSNMLRLLPMVIRQGSAKRARTMSAITLLALGTFTVIITGANRTTFYGSEQDRQSGTGGFLLWTETTMPLLFDLNTPAGRSHFTLQDEPLFDSVRFVQLHRLEGNDASCLNLNQVPQPMMLGVPEQLFDSLDLFTLVNLLPAIDPNHPWRILEQELSSRLIPAFADQSVITWGLGKQLGDTLVYVDESGKEVKVRLMGGLDNSIFQGHILIADHLLKKYYPSFSGSRIMLVDGHQAKQKEIAGRLEEIFMDYGMVSVPASDRLAEFNSVENTYLSVFMLLGAFGVLIGTLGFGILLLRNNLERGAELALFRAIGYTSGLIRNMLIMEYMLILFAGMALGIIGAAAGILPSLISPAYQMPGGFLLIILGIIWLSGTLWIVIPVLGLFRKQMSRYRMPDTLILTSGASVPGCH